MKKILIIINGFHLSQHILDYAIHIAKKENAILYGLFVQSLKTKNMDTYPFPSDINLTSSDFNKENRQEDILQLENAQIKVFEDFCVAGGVNFFTRKIHENFLDTLIEQSAFADLMICDAGMEETYYSLNSLLVNLYCPILLIPKDINIFESIIVTYDGSSSSIHAMRQFAYLFTSWHHLPVYLVSVLPHNIREIEYKDLVEEWLRLQFPNAGIEVLKGDVKEDLPLFISLYKNALVVMGSFGRNSLSRFFKESLANVVLAKTKTALFITHN